MANESDKQPPVKVEQTGPAVDAQQAHFDAGNRMIAEVQGGPVGAPSGGSPSDAILAGMRAQAHQAELMNTYKPVIDASVLPATTAASDARPLPATLSANDSGYSIQQLASAGAIKMVDAPATTTDATAPKGDAPAALPAATDAAPVDKQERAAERQLEQPPRTDPVENIRVTLSDTNNDPSERFNDPDFRIKKDGTIECLHDPEKTNKKELVVEVERDQGDVGPPTAEQQKAADGLVGYLAGRFIPQQPDGSRNGQIDDQQGAVSDQTKANAGTQPAPEQSFDPQARQEIQNMNRFNGGGRGTVSPEQMDNYIPKRDVPRGDDESVRTAAVKDMIAGMANVGEAKPYEAVRQFGDRGFGVGRYMLTYDMLKSWLDDLLGDPPDPKKLEELAKKDPKLAAFLKSDGFKHLMEKLKKGEQPTADELKAGLPKEMQEKAAGHLIQKFAEATKDADGNVEAGKIALAMRLGHAPTDEELKNPANQQFVQAADRLFGIAEYKNERPGERMDWQDVTQRDATTGDMHHRIMLNAENSIGKAIWADSKFNARDLEYGNLGCAATVSEFYRRAGVHGVYSAGVSEMKSQIARQGGYKVSLNNAQPGDAIVLGNDQHVVIYAGMENGVPMMIGNSSAKRATVKLPLATERSYFRGGKMEVWHLPEANETKDA